MRIAVISSDFHATLEWLRITYEIEKPSPNLRLQRDKHGVEYIIVSNLDHVRGLEIDAYITAPDYRSLVDEVRSRIRPMGNYK